MAEGVRYLYPIDLDPVKEAINLVDRAKAPRLAYLLYLLVRDRADPVYSIDSVYLADLVYPLVYPVDPESVDL